MQVVETGQGSALCAGMGHERRVNTMAVGAEVLVGDWLLVVMDNARERLTEQDAERISKALSSLLELNSVTASQSLTADWLAEKFPDLQPPSLSKPESHLSLSDSDVPDLQADEQAEDRA